MDRLEKCKKLCEQIEINYLHRDNFKLSAAVKYLELCNEWIGLVDPLDMKAVKYAFGLLIQPLPNHLRSLIEKKKTEELKQFFLIALEFFNHCVNRCDKLDEESLFACLQMCIDVQKLRLVAFPENFELFDEAFEYVAHNSAAFPANGMLWFQKCIIEYTLRPFKITKFSQLESLIRCITAKTNRPSPSQLMVLIKKLYGDFNNNLLGFLMKDLESVAVSRAKHWAFLRYFDRFVCSSHSAFAADELVCVCMLAFGMLLMERNDQALLSFISSVLNASNPSVQRHWPIVLLLSLKFIDKFSLTMSNPFWMTVLQAMRGEYSSSLTSESLHFLDCLTGTVLGNSSSLKLFSQYDFEEDLSIERDAFIAQLDLFFYKDGAFCNFVCKQDGEYRLGAKLETELAIERKPELKNDAALFVLKDNSKLDQDITGLQERLKELETKEQATSVFELDVSTIRFVIDTNALICNDQVIQDVITAQPDHFYLPLIVLGEIEKFKLYSDRKESLAVQAQETLKKLMDTLFVVNNYGRILRTEEIKQQLELMDFLADKRSNDDVIIDICREISKSTKLVLLTDDVNMRLKAKTRQIESISVKEFRKLFHR